MTSDEALDELDELKTGARQIMSSRASRKDIHRIWVRSIVTVLITVLIAVYCSVNGYQIFQNKCVQQKYISNERAAICNHIFIGDRHIVPGPQYSTRIDQITSPVPSPSTTR